MPRIAFFPDSFDEVNGVAHTARQFVAFARSREIPMLCVRAGRFGTGLRQEGALEVLELDRGHWAVRLEEDLSFDPFFFRHAQAVGAALRTFRPDIIHVTGPSELGLLGTWFARRLGVPLAASWHTNVHEYAGRRLTRSLERLGRVGVRTGAAAERLSLAVAARFYRRAQVLFAPNPGLCALLEEQTGRVCHPMPRGVDADLFRPSRRTRPTFAGGTATRPVLGYVGRLSVEKNVALLPGVHTALLRRGYHPHWAIVGHGAEERSLRRALGPDAVFPGVLRGEALASAYANMDLLVFPSHTDTFGNVVLEALASGVPAVVTPDGGPAYTVQHGITGQVVPDEAFAPTIAELLAAPAEMARMRQLARAYALGCTWDQVFERVVAAYPVRAANGR